MKLAGRGITVFCSSSDAAALHYQQAAAELGTALARRGAITVYGGASVGLMGALANAAIAAGGRVVGVIPRQLVEREVAHSGLSEQHVVENMHQRKMMLSERASAYVVLPGGFGTYEEFFEVVAWRTLGIHDKPIVLLNMDGFYDAALAQVHRATEEKMIRREYAAFVQVATSVDEVMKLLESDLPSSRPAEKWI